MAPFHRPPRGHRRARPKRYDGRMPARDRPPEPPEPPAPLQAKPDAVAGHSRSGRGYDHRCGHSAVCKVTGHGGCACHLGGGPPPDRLRLDGHRLPVHMVPLHWAAIQLGQTGTPDPRPHITPPGAPRPGPGPGCGVRISPWPSCRMAAPRYGKSPGRGGGRTKGRRIRGTGRKRPAGTPAGEMPGPVPCGGEPPCDRRMCGGGITQDKGRLPTSASLWPDRPPPRRESGMIYGAAPAPGVWWAPPTVGRGWRGWGYPPAYRPGVTSTLSCLMKYNYDDRP